MEEQTRSIEQTLKDIEKDIQNILNDGYNIDELNKIDKADLYGFIWAVAMTESAFDNLDCFMDNSIIGKIRQEEAQATWESVYQTLICEGANLVVSFMDGNPEYWEK